jgi:flagellar hook-associated protein 1
VSFVGLYTGLSGIRAAQTGIDTTSHNVANAATPGYTRQRVELSPSHSFQSPAGQIGTGVTVESIGRLRDAFLDDRYRAAIGEHGAAATGADLLSRLEQLAGETDQGIADRLSRLWAAAETWANDPADPVTRRQVLSELSSVSDGMRTVGGAWDSLARDTADRLTTVTTTASDRLATLHELNTKLAGADPAKIGPELYDQRDVLLDELAGLTGAQIRIDGDGRATATVDGLDLLTPQGAVTLEVVDGQLVAHPPDGGAPTELTGIGGELGGLVTALGEHLPRLRGELDHLARTFADAVNTVNASGARPDGSPGGALLTYDADDVAGTLQLVGDDPALLAAATGPDPQPHDGSNARALADLRTTKVLGVGENAEDEATIEGRLADLVTGLAGQVRTERSNADAARSVYQAAALARTSEHGVSIDEEMVGLVRYQRSLEAASRVMTTVDEALDVLVNRTGIVGR